MTANNMRREPDSLSDALAALRSSDVLTQNEGVEAAIQIGSAAVPGLLSFLNEPGASRFQVMYALARVGDAQAEQAFLSGLRDGDERVRAYAAQGLVQIGHPAALAACLQTLNDAPDELHLDRTPSVAALGGMGLKAAAALLEALMNPDEMTRLHGQRALELILSRRHGFRPGQGLPSPAATESLRAEWRTNGDYDYRAEAGVRSASVAAWHRWLATTPE